MAAALRVAIAQIAPALLDRDLTVVRIADAVAEAARGGARLVCFGEAVVPGYPVWLSRGGAAFDDPTQKQIHARYLDQAVDLAAGQLMPVAAAARRHGCWVVLGVVERPADRAGHSLYCAAVVIDDHGATRSVHRKLVPTYEERLAWAAGDGHGLRTHALDGFTLGVLNCWENWLPLARAALHAQGENVHVALWPGSAANTRDSTRFFALEGRSYVLSAAALIRSSDLPAGLPGRDALLAADPRALWHDGGSAIAGPDGAWVCPPLVGVEGILRAELALDRVREERQNFDPSGHYARPDVLQLRVDRRRQAAVDLRED